MQLCRTAVSKPGLCSEATKEECQAGTSTPHSPEATSCNPPRHFQDKGSVGMETCLAWGRGGSRTHDIYRKVVGIQKNFAVFCG